MKVYTRRGDAGMTTLASATQISKADERINTLGAVEELSAQIGLAKVALTSIPGTPEHVRMLAHLQQVLSIVSAGITDARNRKYLLPPDEMTLLEAKTDALAADLSPEEGTFVPGECEASARLGVARAVARRAERALVTMDRKYAAQAASKAYLNRISDYLFVLARWVDHINNAEVKQSNEEMSSPVKVAAMAVSTMTGASTSGPSQSESALQMGAVPVAEAVISGNVKDSPLMKEIVTEVLRQVEGISSLNLEMATHLIREIENYAAAQGKRAVIAVCNAEGNPIAVHVMDGAFLVSYEVALRKAYTAVAVKMSTKELSALTQPGQTFYGLQNMEKMVTFGGGVPLKTGGRIIGGLGISGGTGEEDHALCEYGLQVFSRLS